ncbi:mitochondrial ribosomal protein L27 [Lycorma delicatula]|uniref:mitochondrial ribosomal protein L27 n=1 Tax=Lycorma delicatula TaxID=130591 RepID=UPI003F51A71B
MSQLLSNYISSYLNVFNKVINYTIRGASKKTSSSTSYGGKRRPKHRGIRVQHGKYVTPGTILAVQRRIQFHPGLHVGFGRNGNLFAIEAGKVMITCEKADLNWDHTWVQRNYNGRFNQTIYKKYLHVIPEPQHQRFKLIDMV